MMRKYTLIILIILSVLGVKQAYAIKKDGDKLTNEYSCYMEKECTCRQMTKRAVKKRDKNSNNTKGQALCKIQQQKKDSFCFLELFKKVLKITLMLLGVVALLKYIKTKPITKKKK